MKRVFLSFAAEDMNHVRGLRLLAANPEYEGVEFFDESVRRQIESTDNAYVRRVIRDKINRTSVTVCLIGPTTHTSTWVNWELEESEKKGNTIIAMALKGVGAVTLPTLIRTRGIDYWVWDPEHLGRLIAAA
jgi:hypothetical protein